MIKYNIEMTRNTYKKEYSNYLEIMAEALKRDDFKSYEVVKEMLDETVNEMKEYKSLLSEMKTDNFGVLNHIFEEALPTLIKKNKKAVRKVITTIKEDKNLLGEFNFYNAIRNACKRDVDYDRVLSEITSIAEKNVNHKTVKLSNEKLRKVMAENGIVPMDYVSKDVKKLYENGHAILTSKKTFSNAVDLMESYDSIKSYMEANKKVTNVNEEKSIDEALLEFEGNLKDTLTESEVSLVKTITDFRSPIAEMRKEKLFNKFKDECIGKINEMLKSDSNNEELKDLKKKIEEQKFNHETIVKDIAKLLEIRDILMED